MSHDATVKRPPGTLRREEAAGRASASGMPSAAPTEARLPAEQPDSVELGTCDFNIGSVIRERYELVEILGSGAMGTVFLAKDRLEEEYEERDPYVAIKLLGASFASHPQAKITLEREARKARNLSHDNVVKVFYFDEYCGNPYMVMEYMRGSSLDEWLRAYPNGLSFGEAWPIVRDIAHGLGYLHGQDMVHSDFKPGNVFVAEDGTAKILDLGIARASARSERAKSTSFDVGTLGGMTPPYASPEMFEGEEPDPRDDLYALGCVVYELLTGKHPFNGTWSIYARRKNLAVPRVEGKLSERRWRALERALAFDRNDRTASVNDFLEEFEGRRDNTRSRLIAVATASALLAGLLAAWIVPDADPDEVLVNALLEGAGTQPLDDTGLSRIENWLAQGTDYIAFARESFATLDAAGGHRDLRGGADNAERAFLNVLELTRSEQAARGLVAIVDAYAEGAEQFRDRGDAETAVWLACQGYDLHPNNGRLNRLLEPFVPEGSTDVAGVCRAKRSK